MFYNTNSSSGTNSSYIKDYYLQNRPQMSGVTNVIPVNFAINIPVYHSEYYPESTIKSQILDQVTSWIAQHPTKYPFFIILSYEVPFAIDDSTPRESAWSYLKRHMPGISPFVTTLNVGSTNATRAY